MDRIERSSSRITFIDRFPPAQRFVLFFFGLLPLVAPYELLIEPSWKTGAVVFAFLPAVISLGAIAVSIIFIYSALFGAEQHITFDSGLRTIIHRSRPGLAGLREQRQPFGAVERIELRIHEWSDGPASHNIVLSILRGPELEFGRFESKEEAEQLREEIVMLLGLPAAAVPGGHAPH